MNLQDEVLIPRDRQTVFDALNDTEILKASIPGCEELIRLENDQLEAKIVVRFGPVKASFASLVTLDASAGPAQFSLSGTGDAGAVGSAKGGAKVDLAEQGDKGDETLLSYEVQIDIVGKLAQLGSRLMEGTTRKLAKKFFTNFETALLADGQDNSDEAPA